MTVTLVDTDRGIEKEFDTEEQAQAKKAEMEELGVESKHLEIKTNGAEVVDEEKPEPAQPVTSEPDEGDLPDEPPVDEDPIDWLPAHFTDTIQGVPTVNRKGYAVIASKYGVSVTAEPVTLASETDFEYAEFKAVATTPEGETYSGFGSAHVERMDGDDKHLLNELAETRAMKRATAWATGIGMTAIEELM